MNEMLKTSERLRAHYISHHLINENNYHFKELFLLDTISRGCDKCRMEFKNCKVKKNHNFMIHHHQVGGSITIGTNEPPMHLLEQGRIKQYTINFDQHKIFYDFFDESIVDSL